jgi:hypothetical protein
MTGLVILLTVLVVKVRFEAVCDCAGHALSVVHRLIVPRLCDGMSARGLALTGLGCAEVTREGGAMHPTPGSTQHAGVHHAGSYLDA